MGDFSTGFGTGFEIGTIIKEKQRAKKILQEVQETLQEWKMSGVEPSYVDKIMMSTLLNQAGASYATSFANIENDKNAMDREKLSQDALNLRTMNDNGMNLIKMIQTAAKEGTLGLIDWFQVPKEMLPPNFDLNKFLDKDTITKLQDESTRQEALNNITGVAKILPEEYRKSYLEQGGVIPEGLQPTTAPKAPGISDYKGAVDYLSKFVNTDPTTFNKIKAGFQNQFPNIDMSGITQESLKTPEKVTTAKPKVQDPNDVLFGTNGIMKNYINSGSQLGDEQKTEIRNNYNLIKPSLSANVRTQVEDYLQQIGIDVNAPIETPIPEPEPTTSKPSFLGNIWNKITKPGGTPAYKGTPQQKDYTAMSDDELADLALFGDTSAIEELKRRGLI